MLRVQAPSRQALNPVGGAPDALIRAVLSTRRTRDRRSRVIDAKTSPPPSTPPGKTAPALTPETKGEVRDAVEAALDALDARQAARGRAAMAPAAGSVNQWLKKAVLLSFRLNPNR